MKLPVEVLIVSASPIYARAVRVVGKTRDVFVVTTTYGKTEAVDASSGRVVWRFTPSGYAGWAGSPQITNATPILSTDRKYVFAAAPNGKPYKLRLSTGANVGGRWPVTITRDPTHEKIGPPLNLSRGLLLEATGGYIGTRRRTRATSSRSTPPPDASYTSGTRSAAIGTS